MIIAFCILTVLLLLGGALLFSKLKREIKVIEKIFLDQKEPNFTVNVDTHSITTQLQEHTLEVKEELNNLPEDILRVVTGSANTHKGKLGELIGYISLKAEYDKIIPLGGIVDFICLTFPTPDKPGKMVFVDIKTGKNARLNSDQRALKKIIQDKHIEFIKLDIDTIDVFSESENESE